MSLTPEQIEEYKAALRSSLSSAIVSNHSALRDEVQKKIKLDGYSYSAAIGAAQWGFAGEGITPEVIRSGFKNGTTINKMQTALNSSLSSIFKKPDIINAASLDQIDQIIAKQLGSFKFPDQKIEGTDATASFGTMPLYQLLGGEQIFRQARAGLASAQEIAFDEQEKTKNATANYNASMNDKVYAAVDVAAQQPESMSVAEAADAVITEYAPVTAPVASDAKLVSQSNDGVSVINVGKRTKEYVPYHPSDKAKELFLDKVKNRFGKPAFLDIQKYLSKEGFSFKSHDAFLKAFKNNNALRDAAAGAYLQVRHKQTYNKALKSGELYIDDEAAAGVYAIAGTNLTGKKVAGLVNAFADCVDCTPEEVVVTASGADTPPPSVPDASVKESAADISV